MEQLPSTLRIVLDFAVVLGLAPLALDCLAGAAAFRRPVAAASSRDRGWLTMVPLSCALSVWLAAIFVLPELASHPRIESPIGLLTLARAAQLGRWPSAPIVEDVVQSARARPDLHSLADLLSMATGRRPANGDLPDSLFVGGSRLRAARPPLATFEGWSTHDLGTGHCFVIVYLRPEVPLAGHRVWLHEYPETRHEYRDVAIAMPTAQWMPGELGWEVFRSNEPGRFTLYAGIEAGGDLGPPVLLGQVDRCASAR
jgi:hypothetical protein